jgi:phage terminase large subunit
VIGIGAGVFDSLVELRKELDDAGQPKIAPHVELADVNVAQKAPARTVQILETEAQPYRLRDYLWLEMATWFREEDPSFAGLDNETAQDLAGELASVRFALDSSGRTVIESKDQMKRRGLRSCDLADSLAATFYTSGVIGKKLLRELLQEAGIVHTCEYNCGRNHPQFVTCCKIWSFSSSKAAFSSAPRFNHLR